MISIYDLDIDDNESYEDILKICFPVYHLPIDETDKYIGGTGFLISDNGVFLSAGHNFKNELDTYKAYFGNREYKINCIYKEYNNESGRDLFIGKLNNFNEKVSSDFELGDSNQLKIGDELKFCGFNKRLSVAKEMVSTGIQVHHDDIIFYGHILSETLDSVGNKSKERLLDKRMSSPSMKVLSNTPYESYHGLSGGPVFMDNKIFGVFLADVFVTSDYIKEVLIEKSINLISD